MINRVRWAGTLVVPVAIFFSSLVFAQSAKSKKEPLGLAPIIGPADNPYSPEKAEPGRLLYFDPRLSADGAVSCATCHAPKFALTDGAGVSTGIKGQKGGP